MAGTVQHKLHVSFLLILIYSTFNKVLLVGRFVALTSAVAVWSNGAWWHVYTNVFSALWLPRWSASLTSSVKNQVVLWCLVCYLILAQCPCTYTHTTLSQPLWKKQGKGEIIRSGRRQWAKNTDSCCCYWFYLHSSWGCRFSYFSLTWDTPKSGCNQWSASECRWVKRRPREDTQRNLWISAIFWITPC